jgi:hypothetical protein
MTYAYAAVFTIALTALIVIGTLWLRGGRPVVVASRDRLLALFAGLALIMLLLAIALQAPARETVVVGLSGGSAAFAAYWLVRRPPLSFVRPGIAR